MEIPINADLHYKQGIALQSEATQVAYGGAVGGGKSHLGRIAAITYSAVIPGLQTYLFRRESNELIKNHMEGVTSFPAMLQPWIAVGKAKVVKNEIRFWNGSKIFLCHCQYEKDVFHWLGPEMYFLIVEQAEQFSVFMLEMLFGRNRMPEALGIPEKYRHLFPRVLYTFNPGGESHQFFKTQFSDEWKKRRTPEDPFPIWTAPADQGGRRRQFIQALLADNPSVDPVAYAATLNALPPRMRAALLNGDMDQVIGAFYPDLQRDTHLVRPFTIPEHWPRYMAMDWGACGEGDPFVIGWWCISDGSVPPYPKDSAFCYRVYRGHGLPKVTVGAVADEIKKREAKDPEIFMRVAGGDIKNDNGLGTSVFDEFARHGVAFLDADRRRSHGLQQLQERIVGINGRPLIYWFETTELSFDAIRTVQHDTMGDPNDILQKNDHDIDQARYFAMARPLAKMLLPEVSPAVQNGRVEVARYVASVRREARGPHL